MPNVKGIGTVLRTMPGRLSQVSLLLLLTLSAASRAQVSEDSKNASILKIDIANGVLDSTENKAQPGNSDSIPTVSLDMYEYWVADTAESVSFRLHVRNQADSMIVLDRVEPSCGCIMTTIQKSYARKGKDAEIYIGLMTNRMSETQPYTVDVYTNVNPDTPMRLYIRKKLNEQPNETE